MQVVESQRYVAHGEAQRVRSVILPAGRGAIVDRNGADLSLSVGGGAVAVVPDEVEDVAEVAFGLAPLLDADPNDLVEPITRDAPFAYVRRQFALGHGRGRRRSRSARRAGARRAPPRAPDRRSRPIGHRPRRVVDGAGVSGLEAQWDDVLAGVPGRLVVERDPRGNTIATGRNQREAADQGDDLMLTIDRELQFEAERALAEQVDALDARGGTVIVSVPQSGEILAMAKRDRGRSRHRGGGPRPPRLGPTGP